MATMGSGQVGRSVPRLEGRAKITGRAESVGRPLLYGTTQDFLRHFGLGSMRDLPKPCEIEELMNHANGRSYVFAVEITSPINYDP